MVKLIVLIIASIILFVVFVIILISGFFYKTKRLFILSILSFLLCFCTGMYTIYFGLKKGKEKTEYIAQKSFEKVFPTFNSDIPDTEANKKNFRNFLQVDITTDVKDIYCYDDAIGQDSDYMFSFSCDTITKNKIIEQHQLVKNSIIENNSDGLQNDFFWWNKDVIKKLESYSWNSNSDRKNLYKTLWYDKKNNKAYYFEYSL